jgi:hypothetical protein
VAQRERSQFLLHRLCQPLKPYMIDNVYWRSPILVKTLLLNYMNVVCGADESWLPIAQGR